MRIGKTTGVFLSGCCVYALMAACSGSVAVISGASAGGQGGSPADSGLLDALTDPVPAVDASPMSGSRLKKRYLLADDGTREDLPGWYDAQRQEQCAFGLAADGMTRCLPVALAEAGYADDKCTLAINFLPLPTDVVCGVANEYVKRAVDAPCPGSYHIFSVEPQPIQISDTSCRYYWSSNQCLNMGCQGPVGQMITVYKVGQEIDPTAFVGAAMMTDP